jgi:hypothetical protein
MSLLGFNQFVEIEGEDVDRYWDAILLVLLEAINRLLVLVPGSSVSILLAAILQ